MGVRGVDVSVVLTYGFALSLWKAFGRRRFLLQYRLTFTDLGAGGMSSSAGTRKVDDLAGVGGAFSPAWVTAGKWAWVTSFAMIFG